MKLVFVALVVALAVTQAERLCRNNCDDTDQQDDGTADGCFCDDACVDAGDCCDSYFDFCDSAGCAEADACGSSDQFTDVDGQCFCDEACVGAGDCCVNYASECDGVTDDTACFGCPDGAQQATGAGASRANCYCDDACVDAGDCCPSYTTYCGDAIIASDRAAFCDILEGSASAFCDNGMRQAYYFGIESKAGPGSITDQASGLAYALGAYNNTCLLDPEVVEDDAETCHTDVYGLHWRFGCAGLNSVWAQRCDSSSCRESQCDTPWRRDYWGAEEQVLDAMIPTQFISGGPYRGDNEFPFEYHEDETDGRLPSMAGQCSMIFSDECDPGADIDRIDAWVYGCLDSYYDASDVEYLDWESEGRSASHYNGDSTIRRKVDLIIGLSPDVVYGWESAFQEDYNLETCTTPEYHHDFD